MRQGYRFGVSWIGLNDEPETMNPEEIAGMISVLLLADLFGKEPEAVAKDVVRYRKTLERVFEGVSK
jgi:hypothetical protein